MTKNRSLGEAGPSVHQIFVGSDKIGQNVGNKVKKPSTTGQDMITLMSIFAYFLGCYWQSLTSGRETEH